jgi:hypothetical protein
MSVEPERAILNRIKPERRVSEGTVSLIANSRSVRTSLPLDPVRHAGRDPDDPGQCSWYYIRDQELLIFDLGGGFK